RVGAYPAGPRRRLRRAQAVPRVCLLGSQHLLGAKRVPRGLWGQRLALRPGHIDQAGLHGTPPPPRTSTRAHPNPPPPRRPPTETPRTPAAGQQPLLSDGCSRGATDPQRSRRNTPVHSAVPTSPHAIACV